MHAFVHEDGVVVLGGVAARGVAKAPALRHHNVVGRGPVEGLIPGVVDGDAQARDDGVGSSVGVDGIDAGLLVRWREAVYLVGVEEREAKRYEAAFVVALAGELLPFDARSGALPAAYLGAKRGPLLIRGP